MSLSRGIDLSNYTTDISVERIAVLHDNHGVDFAIIGCQVGNDGKSYTQLQKDNSLAAGISVQYHYEFLYWNAGDIDRIRRAASFGLPVWLDCETESPGWTHDQFADRIGEARDTLKSEGLYAGIYTGEWWWPGHINSNTTFSTDPLWHAAYPYGSGVLPPEDYVVDFSTFHPYGGWTTPTIWQYSDKCYGEPVGIDMNYMELVTMKDGWIKEGHAWTLYNEGTPIERRGSIDGSGTPGQISKNFGGTWYYLVHGESPDGGHTSPAIFSDTPGD